MSQRLNVMDFFEELEKITAPKLKDNPRLWFGDGETNRTNDARCQTEDLGDDAVKAGEYGIKNLRRMLPKLPEWTYENTDIYNRNLSGMYDQVVSQYVRYCNHVIRNLGGVYCDYHTVDQPGPIYTDEPKAKQLDAFRFVTRHILEEPTWLTAPDYMNRITPNPQRVSNNLGTRFMATLVSPALLNRLTDTYPASEYLPALLRATFDFKPQTSPYRQALQRKAVVGLIEYFEAEKDRDPWPVVLQQLRWLRSRCQTLQGQAHYAALADMIDRALAVDK